MVTVTKEVAKTIEALREYGYSNAQIVYEMEKGGLLQKPLDTYFNEAPRTTDDLLSALVNGYEVEKSPEDKAREYYERCVSNRREAQDDGRKYAVEHFDGQAIGASITLDILGIKIEGVNA